VLDPPLVEAQSVQDPRIGEVPRHDPAQRELGVARLVQTGPGYLGEESLQGVGGVLGQQGAEDLGLNAFGPPQPPGQPDRPLGQCQLHLPDWRHLRQHPLAVELELARVLPRDHRLPGQ